MTKKGRAASRLIIDRELAKAIQEREWVCASCSVMLDPVDDGPYCRTCRSYWEDVRNGLFDLPWRDE